MFCGTLTGCVLIVLKMNSKFQYTDQPNSSWNRSLAGSESHHQLLHMLRNVDRYWCIFVPSLVLCSTDQQSDRHARNIRQLSTCILCQDLMKKLPIFGSMRRETRNRQAFKDPLLRDLIRVESYGKTGSPLSSQFLLPLTPTLTIHLPNLNIHHRIPLKILYRSLAWT
ncbi:hypothetical protein M3J09_011524 [Ascochyta lentis]